MKSGRVIRVLVIDDSALVRRMIQDALRQEPGIEVLGAAVDPYHARDLILELNPDVLTLDLEMPRMDGLTFLQHLMAKHPLPVVVLSSLTQKGSEEALLALERGAVEVLAKPSGSFSLGETGKVLGETIRRAATANVALQRGLARPPAAAPDAPLKRSYGIRRLRDQMGLIGASTGGTEAIRQVLEKLPEDSPPLCLVQHIPAFISGSFAQRLNQCCPMEVREARDGDRLKDGLALLAPGDWHMLVEEDASGYFVRLRQGPKVWHQRPSVDVLFRSAAALPRARIVASVLTGMGKDGAEGLLTLRRRGAETFVQDESSCVVFGMPKAALECGATDHAYPLSEIAANFVSRFDAQATQIKPPPAAHT